MVETYTNRKVMLCANHLKCRVCRNQVESGKFATGRGMVVCVLPEGTPNRLESTCAFRCGQCQKILLKNELSEQYEDDGAADDEELFCEDCLTRCEECDAYEHLVKVEYEFMERNLCIDCVPAGVRRRVTYVYDATDRRF